VVSPSGAETVVAVLIVQSLPWDPQLDDGVVC